MPSSCFLAALSSAATFTVAINSLLFEGVDPRGVAPPSMVLSETFRTGADARSSLAAARPLNDVVDLGTLLLALQGDRTAAVTKF